MRLYSIFDRKAHLYADPLGVLLFNSDDLVKRAMVPAIESKQLPPLVLRYPGDFDLYCIGELDQSTGAISPLNEYVCSIADLTEEKEDA